MKKTKTMTGRLLSLLLAGVLASGTVVSGEELFTDVPAQEEVLATEEPQAEGTTEAAADVPEPYPETESSQEMGSLAEGQAEEELFTAPEAEAVLDDGQGEDLPQEERTMTQEEIDAQLLPMENLSEIFCVEPPRSSGNGINGIRTYGAEALPAKYDTRGSSTTMVKNQKPFGMCWAFTTAAGLETSLMRKGLGVYDLSEEHLAYFFANRQNDPLGNTANDRNVVYDSYRQGGNQVLASIFLSTWSGMGLESEVPYPTDVTNTVSYSTKPSDNYAYKTTAYLTEAVFSDYDVTKIKQLIRDYGSVGLSLCLESYYYNVKESAYSCADENAKANHAVTLVGWDDTYPKENFGASSRVTSDGAWIAKNSWGLQWGEQGYFYISYENKGNYNIVAEAGTTNPDYPNNYFYDGSSALSSFSLARASSSDTAAATRIANVFAANAGKGKAEMLGEVVVATHSDGSSFGIQVYTNLTDPEDPESGIPAYKTPVSFYQPYAGISTVSIPEVELMQGTLYSIVLTNQGGDSMNYLVECDGNYGWIGFQAGLSPQQSFVYSKNYGWSDLYRSDMCLRIKAHTRTLESASVLGTPIGVKAKSKGYNQISLAWDPIPNASGYEIFRKAPGSEYEKIDGVNYKAVSWTDKKVKLGVKYSYRIRAFSVLNGEKCYSGYSPEVSQKAALTAPKTSVKVYGSVRNKISWTKTPGAQGYMIYRRSSGKKWKLLSSVKASGGRSYVDKAPSPGVTYEYGVRAYRKSGKKTYKSACLSSGKWKTSAARQGVKALKNERKGIRVTWTPQKNCDGYYVYRKEGSGKWQRVARLPKGTAGSYLDSKAKRGKTYTYYVRALVKNGEKLLQSRYSKSQSIKR